MDGPRREAHAIQIMYDGLITPRACHNNIQRIPAAGGRRAPGDGRRRNTMSEEQLQIGGDGGGDGDGVDE